MNLSRRQRFAGHAIIVIGVAMAVKILWVPNSWQIASTMPAGQCTFRRGATQPEVARACGAPDSVGIQPKVLSDRALAPKEWISFCSAPCEIRQGRIVFYDCSGGVADVRTVHQAYNDGCVRQDGRTSRMMSISALQLFAPPKQ